MVLLLVEHGANIDVQDSSGDTSLHYAVLFESTEMVRMLVEYEADATIAATSNKTPMEMATNKSEPATKHVKKFQAFYKVKKLSES